MGLLYAVWLFQFYDSPIKSTSECFDEAFLFKFQFYDSPIKRPHNGRAFGEVRSFNSMIVRLKGPPHTEKTTRPGFNSMIVRLKVVRVVQLPLPLLQSFNSMIVRLKGRPMDGCELMESGFNSMIVRLKEGSGSMQTLRRTPVSIL